MHFLGFIAELGQTCGAGRRLDPINTFIHLPIVEQLYAFSIHTFRIDVLLQLLLKFLTFLPALDPHVAQDHLRLV